MEKLIDSICVWSIRCFNLYGEVDCQYLRVVNPWFWSLWMGRLTVSACGQSVVLIFMVRLIDSICVWSIRCFNIYGEVDWQYLRVVNPWFCWPYGSRAEQLHRSLRDHPPPPLSTADSDGYHSALRSQKLGAAYLISKQLLGFGFAQQPSGRYRDGTDWIKVTREGSLKWGVRESMGYGNLFYLFFVS